MSEKKKSVASHIILRLLATTLASSWSFAGTAGSSESSVATNPWNESGRAAVEARLSLQPNTSRAKNVILFVGDGMGVSTITAARIYDGQSRGLSGEENVLSFERLPYSALVKTYNSNQQVPDSAGTASALHTGVKTRAGVIGVGPAPRRADCAASLAHHLPNLGELAEASGKRTGIVTTARLTHATPAAVYAHSPERNWEADSEMPAAALEEGCADIARQLVDFSFGDGIDVALGGGRRNFFGASLDGESKRLDPDDNLPAEWLARVPDRHYVETAEELDSVKKGQVLGLFSETHMTFMRERPEDTTEPTLSEMTAKAIDLLEGSDEGYYLLVEGGRIDLGHHLGIAEHALAEAQEFARAVEVALAKVNLDETLVLVTADHSHVFTIAGYPTRGNPILGLARGNDEHGEPTGKPILAADGEPYTTLGYWNGSSAITGERPSPEVGHLSKQQALVPLASESHGGEDVALFAAGPWSHLVGGVMEQHVIFHIIVHAYGWD